MRDWCRFNGAGTSCIDPGSPWQNAYVEAFNARLRDELLSCEVFDTLIEAKVLLEDWRIDYNWNRPHSALGNQPPAKYAATLKKQPAPPQELAPQTGSPHYGWFDLHRFDFPTLPLAVVPNVGQRGLLI